MPPSCSWKSKSINFYTVRSFARRFAVCSEQKLRKNLLFGMFLSRGVTYMCYQVCTRPSYLWEILQRNSSLESQNMSTTARDSVKAVWKMHLDCSANIKSVQKGEKQLLLSLEIPGYIKNASQSFFLVLPISIPILGHITSYLHNTQLSC
jgi:hypothetical protein